MSKKTTRAINLVGQIRGMKYAHASLARIIGQHENLLQDTEEQLRNVKVIIQTLERDAQRTAHPD